MGFRSTRLCIEILIFKLVNMIPSMNCNKQMVDI